MTELVQNKTQSQRQRIIIVIIPVIYSH